MGLSLSKNVCAKSAEVVEQSLTPNMVEKILTTNISKINDNIKKTCKEINKIN
jgi:hypothetical protein